MVETIRASDIMNQEYSPIKGGEKVSKALGLFRGSTNILVMLDSKGRYSGMVPERNLFRATMDPDKAKVSSFKVNAPKIDPQTTAPECARLMIENDTMCLPVLEKNRVVGVVKGINILQSAAFKDFGKGKVSQYMSPDPLVASPKDKVSTVLNTFKESQISRMPVVEDGKLKGIITLHDIIQTAVRRRKGPAYGYIIKEKDSVLDWTIDKVMREAIVTSRVDEPVSEVIMKMVDNDVNSIVIVDNDERLMGIITKKDLLEPIVERVPARSDHITINSNAEDLDRSSITEMVHYYIDKYPSKFSDSSFNVYIKKHRERMKGDHLIFTRVKVVTPKGRFDARAEAWGAESSLRTCLAKIERQVLSKTDFRDRDKRKRFLEQIDLENL